MELSNVCIREDGKLGYVTWPMYIIVGMFQKRGEVMFWFKSLLEAKNG